MRHLVTSLVFILLALACKAQTKDSVFYKITPSFQSSFILAQRQPALQFEKDHPWIVQVDWGVLKTTRRSWNYCNCYSQNGLSLGYINFDNPVKLGHAFKVTGFIEPYLINFRKFTLSLRGAAGLAFLDKVYDSLTNRDNIFVSTKLSFMLGVGTNISYSLSNSFRIKAGFHLNHISNGGRRDPNDGMNFLSYNFGLEYSIKPQAIKPQPNQKFTEKRISLVVHLLGNQRTAQATSLWPEEARLVLGTNVGIVKRIGRMNGVGIGAEYVYDGINAVKQQRLNILMQTSVGAVSLQHYLLFGKLIFGQQLGFYVTPNPGYPNAVFQRYLLEYEFRKNWYAGFSLKSHADKSDYFAFSTGYFFKL